jgi:hypothetical protein
VLLAAAEDASELVVGKHGRVIGRDLLLDTSVPTIVVGAVDTLVPLAFAGQRAER